jgi:acyl-CoA thioester hydrolase
MSGEEPSAMISAAIQAKAQFYDLDPMEVVWHGNYPRFLEQARCALLDKIAFNYVEMSRTDYIWPIVDMRIKYVRPIRFGQEIRVTATLTEYENRIKIDYVITDAGTGEALTKAQTVQVAVHKATGETVFESPAELRGAVSRVAS